MRNLYIKAYIYQRIDAFLSILTLFTYTAVLKSPYIRGVYAYHTRRRKLAFVSFILTNSLEYRIR